MSSCQRCQKDSRESSVGVGIAPILRHSRLELDEGVAVDTGLQLVLVLLILDRPLHLLRPVKYPPHPALVFLVFEVKDGLYEVLVDLDPIPTTLTP